MEYNEYITNEHIVKKLDNGTKLYIPHDVYLENAQKVASVIALGVLIAWLLLFTLVYKSYNQKPKTNPDGSEIPVLMKQNNSNYISVLELIPTCKLVLDDSDVKYLSCPDGTKVTQTKWRRGEDRGIVTRQYDKFNNEMSRYGHPDDR